MLTLSLACGYASSLPPTLQVQEPSATFTDPAKVRPTPSLPAGAVADRLVNPSMHDLLNQVQSDKLMVAVGTLADMHTRHVLSEALKTGGGIAGARTWLLGQFNALHDANPDQAITTWTQPVQYYWNGFNVSSQNVISIIQGTDVGAGVVLISAHYDSMPADYMNGQADAPGANANGSGVAAMLEIARILAGRPHRATLIFAAFTAEETGRQGSLTFVQSYLQAQKSPIDLRAVINLDMIGNGVSTGVDNASSAIRLFSAEPNESASRQLARQIALITKTYVDNLEPVVQSAEERAGRWGDQQSFPAAGYPAVRIIQERDDPAREHNASDTLDNVQPGYLMLTTRAALAAIDVLVDGLAPPGDVALTVNPNDPTQQTLNWSPVPGAAAYLVTLRQIPSLYFDQVFSVKSTELAWGGFRHYAMISVASVDAAGRMGPLSSEMSIASLLNR